MKSHVAIIRNALTRSQRRRETSTRATRAIVAYRAQNVLPAIPTPAPMPPSRFEEEMAETGGFVMHCVVTEWNVQPGSPSARLGLQDFEMNAAMAQAGQTNVNLTISDRLARFIAPQQRVRVTVELE